MNYTPGPWSVFGPVKTGFSGEFFCVVNEKDKICQTRGDMEARIPDDIERQKADAILIAAAPEMHEALKEAWLHLCRIGDVGRQRESDPKCIEMIRNVLQKVEGK